MHKHRQRISFGTGAGALALIAKSCKVVWYIVWGQHIYKRWLRSGDSGGLSLDCFLCFRRKSRCCALRWLREMQKKLTFDSKATSAPRCQCLWKIFWGWTPARQKRDITYIHSIIYRYTSQDASGAIKNTQGNSRSSERSIQHKSICINSCSSPAWWTSVVRTK